MKIVYIFILFYFVTQIILGQTLYLEESFNYYTGDLNGQGNWNLTAIGATNILTVVPGSLCNDPFPSGCNFNSVQIISGGDRQDCAKEFTSTSITSGTIYVSFLIQVNSCGSDGDNDGYFLCLMPSGTENVCRISIDFVSSDEIKFGIQRNSGTGGSRSLTPGYVYSAGTYVFLIVMKYDFDTGVASLFVNPSFSGGEPSVADASNDTGNSISEITRIQLRQGGDPFDCDVVIDGMRISDSWSLAPLPVELSLFTTKLVNDNIQLNWETKTEVNNYGFYIEKSINEGEWNSIGFVEGHGNSNSPKEYSFTDKNLIGGSRFQYRLKQIDTDGSFEYSDVVEVEVLPTQYELSQNYPNPFNPSTTIRFSLPKETQLKINIYNMLGELVETLAEGNYEAGYHKIIYNAQNLPSSAYVYRIESGDFVQTKKMMLMK